MPISKHTIPPGRQGVVPQTLAFDWRDSGPTCEVRAASEPVTPPPAQMVRRKVLQRSNTRLF
jgi:hypothetical protein